jgi:hypothetical protein
VRRPGGVQGHRDYLAEMPSITTTGPHAADAPPDHTQTAPRNQSGTTGPVHVALRTFEQRNPSYWTAPEPEEAAAQYIIGTQIYGRLDSRLPVTPDAIAC